MDSHYRGTERRVRRAPRYFEFGPDHQPDPGGGKLGFGRKCRRTLERVGWCGATVAIAFLLGVTWWPAIQPETGAAHTLRSLVHAQKVELSHPSQAPEWRARFDPIVEAQKEAAKRGAPEWVAMFAKPAHAQAEVQPFDPAEDDMAIPEGVTLERTVDTCPTCVDMPVIEEVPGPAIERDLIVPEGYQVVRKAQQPKYRLVEIPQPDQFVITSPDMLRLQAEELERAIIERLKVRLGVDADYLSEIEERRAPVVVQRAETIDRLAQHINRVQAAMQPVEVQAQLFQTQ